MSDYHRKYPAFSLCGLNCGLCPNYQTTAASRCSGCGSESCFHSTCGLLSCAKQHSGVEYCFLCEDTACTKFEITDEYDSFITHRNQKKDIEKAKVIGLPAYQAELDEKIGLLEYLLEHYNDGRRKSFFCLAVNLLELADIKQVAEQIKAETNPDSAIKEKAAIAVRLFQSMAEDRGVILKLRKK